MLGAVTTQSPTRERELLCEEPNPPQCPNSSDTAGRIITIIIRKPMVSEPRESLSRPMARKVNVGRSGGRHRRPPSFSGCPCRLQTEPPEARRPVCDRPRRKPSGNPPHCHPPGHGRATPPLSAPAPRTNRTTKNRRSQTLSSLRPPAYAVREPLTVGEGGLEPPRPEGHWHLKPARLPFRHSPVASFTV